MKFLPRMAVLLPCKHNLSSTVFSNQIAEFLANTLKIPLIHEGNYDDHDHDFDVLFLINYPFAFCGMEQRLSSMVACAGRVVWVENDYTIVPPKTNHSGPKSPIRLAFGNRKAELIYWTNRPDHVGLRGAYVNWNMLAYQPIPDVPYTKRNGRVVYYGSYRQGRALSFKRYFGPTIDVACGTRTQKKFEEYGAPLVPSLQPMIEGLAQYSASLYLEDEDTHTNYHSPANRYYEALAAGTALLIDDACISTFDAAGITLEPGWIVTSPDSWKDMDFQRIADEQFLFLRQDFRKQLTKDVLKARDTL